MKKTRFVVKNETPEYDSDKRTVTFNVEKITSLYPMQESADISVEGMNVEIPIDIIKRLVQDFTK